MQSYSGESTVLEGNAFGFDSGSELWDLIANQSENFSFFVASLLSLVRSDKKERTAKASEQDQCQRLPWLVPLLRQRCLAHDLPTQHDTFPH